MQRADLIYNDRRIDRRYAFEMPLRFTGVNSGTQGSGSGYTKDLGRKSILFVSDHPPSPNTEVELHIEWPFLLQGVCPLELRVWGRVLRSDQRGTVIAMNKYEFHTCGTRSFDQASAREANWSMVA